MNVFEVAKDNIFTKMVETIIDFDVTHDLNSSHIIRIVGNRKRVVITVHMIVDFNFMDRPLSSSKPKMRTVTAIISGRASEMSKNLLSLTFILVIVFVCFALLG